MRKMLLGMAVVASLTIAAATHAATVYVSSTVAAWSGSGALTDPYGSIQEAYASLWTTGGAHQIYLLSGTYTGDNIGSNPFGGTGVIDFGDGGGGAGGVITGVRAANTFTMGALAPGTVTIDSAPTAGTDAHYSGCNPRGLFSVNNSLVTDIIVEDVDIRLTTNRPLTGKVNASGDVGITFNDVNLFLAGNSFFFRSDASGGPDMTLALQFNNSNIYVDPTTNLGGDTNLELLATRAEFQYPGNTVVGNNSSRLWYWSTGFSNFYDTTQFTILSDLTVLAIGSRDAPGPIPNWSYNGTNIAGNNPSSLMFYNLFLTTLPPAADDDDDDAAAAPEPTTVALLALGAGLVIARRRMNS